MPFQDRNYTTNSRNTVEVQAVNTFTTQVYGWMTIGLALTAFIAWFVYQTGAFIKLMPFWWVTAFGTLGIAMAINAGIKRFAFSTMVFLFLAYAALEGLFFGTVLPVYAAAYGGQVIWMAFGSGALIFGLALAYGLLTKSDLTSLSRILSIGLMGLIGLTLIYFVCSFFMPMHGMMLLISYLGLIIFVALSAYDAQNIRNLSRQVDGYSGASCKLSIMCALKMYINVIMVFWYLLQIFSHSSRR